MAIGTGVRLNAEVLDSYASELLAEKKEMELNFSSLDGAVNAIFDNSEGEAVIAFQERYTKVQTMYENMMLLLQNYADALKKMKENYLKANTEIAKQIRDL